jgi:hypothetical protein
MHPAMPTWFGVEINSKPFRRQIRYDLYWRAFWDRVVRGFRGGLASHIRVVHLYVPHFHASHFMLTGGLMFDLFDLPLLNVAVPAGRVARAKSGGDHVAPRAKEKRDDQDGNRKRSLSHGS